MSTPKLAEKLGGAPHSKQSLRLWLRLLSCSMQIEKRIRQRLSESFETTLPRFDVLSALDRATGGMTMGELSSMLLVSNGNVTPIVSRLVDDGFVERLADERDRRVLRVKLTANGRRAFQVMAAQHAQWIEGMMSGLNSAEIETLLEGLENVRTSIEQSEI